MMYPGLKVKFHKISLGSTIPVTGTHHHWYFETRPHVTSNYGPRLIRECMCVYIICIYVH